MLRKVCKNILLLLLAGSLFLVKNKTAEQETNANNFLYLTDFSNELTQAIASSVIVYATQDGFLDGKTGGGVIWKLDKEMCYIITCAHLFGNMDSPQIYISPFLDESSKTKAVLIGRSIDEDIAILYAKTPESGEKIGEISDANDIGMPVFAFGNPGGKGGAVSAGIVSVPNESIGEQIFHRIDCTLLPGNSGGGLFDGQGQILGIICSKEIGDGSLEGYGFAIPFSVVQTAAISILNNATAESHHSTL